jgi:lysine-N-methylase
VTEPRANAPETTRLRVILAGGARFSCHRCGDCCRSFPVALTDDEAKRYATDELRALVPGLASETFEVVPRPGGKVARLLKRQASGACVFLDEEKNLCRVHGALGEAAKPLACRLFPFTVTPGGGPDPRPRVGCHFACKGLAAGDGAPVAGMRRELESLAEELARVHSLAPRDDALVFVQRRRYARDELELVCDLVVQELEDATRPFPARLLAVSRFLDLFSRSAFKEIKDEKRVELVKVFATGVREQVKKGLLLPPATTPTFPERLLLRQLLGVAVRRDPPGLMTAGIARRTSRRLSGLLAGLAAMAGGGSFTPTGRAKRVRVEAVRSQAPPADPASPEADGALSRYFVAHVGSRRLLDPSFRVPEVLPAFGLLLRQYPLILLFARAACLARGGDVLTSDDYACALRTADWTFGQVPWTAGLIGRTRARLLADLNAPFQHVAWCAAKV